MTVRLTVDRAAWLAHVHGTAAAYGHGLVPVVKGNGYGFGRAALHEAVRSAGAARVCVGSVHELHDVPPTLTPVVLTPTLAAPATTPRRAHRRRSAPRAGAAPLGRPGDDQARRVDASLRHVPRRPAGPSRLPSPMRACCSTPTRCTFRSPAPTTTAWPRSMRGCHTSPRAHPCG